MTGWIYILIIFRIQLAALLNAREILEYKLCLKRKTWFLNYFALSHDLSALFKIMNVEPAPLSGAGNF